MPTIETTTFAPSLGVNLAASTKLTNAEYYRDLTVGTGAVVSSGQTLSVQIPPNAILVFSVRVDSAQ